jgi:hypothetical protein
MGRSLALFAPLVVAALLASRDAAAYHDDDHRLLDHTAHTLDGFEFRIGLWQLDAGISKRVNIGTDTAPYVASFILKRFIPNVHGKVNLYRSPPLTLSLEARFYYAFAGGDGANASIAIVPLTAYVSSDLTPDLSLHGEATYTTVGASATAHAQSLDAKGAVAVQSFQLGAMLEYRLTRVTALTLRGRLQPVFSPAVVRTTVTRDANTNASVDANLEPRYRGATAAVIGGVAFSWKNINLSLGVGYGSFFVPSLGVVLPGNSILPDGSFDVRF